MKRLVTFLTLLLLVLAALYTQAPARAQGSPQVTLLSQYVVNRYGYAVVNETVTFSNNSTGTVQLPDVQVGLGNLSSYVVSYVVSGAGYSVGGSGSTFTVSSGGQSIPAGGNSSFTFSGLLNGIMSKGANSTFNLLLLASPSLSLETKSDVFKVVLPSGTNLLTIPSGFKSVSGTNVTYSETNNNATTPAASTLLGKVQPGSASDFHPIHVFSAVRSVSMGPSGTPLITDTLKFQNIGTTVLKTLYVLPLGVAGSSFTVEPSAEPPLLHPYTSAFGSSYSMDLSNPNIGNPIQPGSNYTISYEYPLPSGYYSVSGGTVTLDLPTAPPIPAFVDTYSIVFSLPSGVSVVQGPPSPATNVSPRETGMATMAYGLTAGWAVGVGLPAGSIIFVLLLVGLFVSRTTMTEEEETEEETSTERTTAMIKAFDEKTVLINGLWAEIKTADPNELDKAYFDEIRGRLDSFRSKALQRLNEVRQKSTNQKFFDLLNEVQTTEREVDRAAKDTLNLYEQFYSRRMRKEVFDRLLPQYNRRLDRSLNQLADELHGIQKEAKLL